ncbi:uncharacterized protein BCR38DRAFT_415538 [Pseudomassariella vexata]|uniref:ER-bound oxygenase mpaB/mpaB'/Rubber oxygenase catalytic domain-containing protein n=1 Tax=Pseudomassariella vexata TaxID=1141098 RepID=A0A1Y2EH89_9PEZI|nr:uncharacterized protein BCR38DRAFT_415538 [Pseudomassariella vexata]ORY70942.1 hypothetical protein BCR38DRAFT_415538 [Pseudomassariella vexata]
MPLPPRACLELSRGVYPRILYVSRGSLTSVKTLHPTHSFLFSSISIAKLKISIMKSWMANNSNASQAPETPLAATLALLPWHLILAALAISYLTLVQQLRFRALQQLERKYTPYLTNPYKLTYPQAREIMHLSMLYDEPFLSVFGTQWALVKSYGMATGTPLLIKTRQLADPNKVGKRAEDTAVFLVELLAGDIDSKRGRLAMAKLNWLHGRYEIIEGDYVHTLALFVLEPMAWIERHGWRPLTRLEQVARLVYWRELGKRMGFGGAIPETLEELKIWKVEYERKHMYYIESNRIVTDATVDLFLRSTPRFMHRFMRAIFVSFIEEKNVREALGYPDPPAWAVFLTSGFFTVRKWSIRHLFLPRMKMMDPLAKPGLDRRLYRSPEFVGFEPWYVADTRYNRLSLWMRSGGRLSPRKDFESRGYLPEELGPVGFEKISREPVKNQVQAEDEYVKLRGSAASCPFVFA